MSESATIVGKATAGGASLSRSDESNGMKLVRAASAEEADAITVACNASDASDVEQMFAPADDTIGIADVVSYNLNAAAL